MGTTTGEGLIPLRVEFLEPPMTRELWRVFEESAHSYGCTREFLEYFDDPEGAALARVGSGAAFLYRCERGTARVLGRFFAPPAESFAAFASALFARDSGLRRIETDFIEALPSPRALGWPSLVLREGLELRVALPDSMEEYERCLDSAFRRHTSRCHRRLARERPSARFTTAERGDIPRSWITDVVRLNHERMASKHTRSTISARYEEGIFRVARSHGYVTVLRDGDRICAGVVHIRTGPEAYFWLIGHDRAYGKFTPGTLCLLASMRHCIDRGVNVLHLLHGESEYKRAVGGKPARLAAYVVLRSWAAATPDDVRRLALKNTKRLAREMMGAADRLAERSLGKRELFTSLARSVRGWARRVEIR